MQQNKVHVRFNIEITRKILQLAKSAPRKNDVILYFSSGPRNLMGPQHSVMPIVGKEVQI